MNAILERDVTAPPPIRYSHIPCWLCQGSGLYCWSFGEQEMQEPCSCCAGKKTIVVEAPQ